MGSGLFLGKYKKMLWPCPPKQPQNEGGKKVCEQEEIYCYVRYLRPPPLCMPPLQKIRKKCSQKMGKEASWREEFSFGLAEGEGLRGRRVSQPFHFVSI